MNVGEIRQPVVCASCCFSPSALPEVASAVAGWTLAPCLPADAGALYHAGAGGAIPRSAPTSREDLCLWERNLASAAREHPAPTAGVDTIRAEDRER